MNEIHIEKTRELVACNWIKNTQWPTKELNRLFQEAQTELGLQGSPQIEALWETVHETHLISAKIALKETFKDLVLSHLNEEELLSLHNNRVFNPNDLAYLKTVQKITEIRAKQGLEFETQFIQTLKANCYQAIKASMAQVLQENR